MSAVEQIDTGLIPPFLVVEPPLAAVAPVQFETVNNASATDAEIAAVMASVTSTPDINITIDINYLRNTLFFDTTMNTSNDIPYNRTDACSVFLHELAHSLGFNG